MPQQYMLINRPVNVNKHSINAISHRKPPSPIGSLSSTSPCSPRSVIKGSMFTNHGDSIQPYYKLEPEVSLVEYQKSVQDNLISINNNLSDMLKETSSGIDIICQKVRMCLLEANSVSAIKRHNSKQLMSICEENLDKVEDIEEEAIAEIVKEEAIAGIVEEEAIAEIVEEGSSDEETNKVEGEIRIATDTQNSLEHLNSFAENCTRTQTRNPCLKPFFTILNPKTLSAESVAVQGLWSITSKLGLSPQCTIENFQKSMQEVSKLNNYEDFFSHMVNDVDEGITRYYTNYKEKYKSRDMNRSTDKRPKSSSGSQDSRSRYQIVNIEMKEKTLQNNELIGMGEDFNEDMRTIHQMMPNNIKEKIGKLQNSLKTHTDRKKTYISLGDITFPCGEVYRKRAFTDLNKRMIKQIQANDSLICFQKLMDKNPNFIKTPKTKNERPSSEMSFPRSPLQQILTNEQCQRQNKRTTNLAKMYKDSLWFKNRTQEGKRVKKESRSKKKFEGKSPNNEKCFSTQSFGSVLTNSSNKIPTKYEVSITNNQPLSEPEKCKMYWMRSKYAQLTKKRLQYMDILENVTDKDILPLKSEYPRSDQVVRKERPKKKVDNVKNSYLYKLLHAEENEKVWADLLKPPMNENCESNKTEVFETAKDEDFDKGKFRRSLSKYIFADIDQIRRNQVFTVMPVQISYDNSRIAAGPVRRSQLLPKTLPLLPMKETKDDIKRAEWSSEINKKPKHMKVVYAPISRKLEKEVNMVSGRQPESKHMTPKLPNTTSWSPKNFDQLYSTYTHQSSGVKTVKVDFLDKAPKKPQPKLAPKLQNQLCKAAKNMERRPRKQLVASTEHSRVQLDMEKNIQKELEMQSLKIRDAQERKIWENKYSKSVGQKLLHFVEKQPSTYKIPVPKYAQPKTIKDPIRQRQMLEKLQVFKHNNDNIQSNIVKAIHLIENKMIDVVSKPAESIDAFEKMEKEITQVLSLLKTSKEGSRKEALPEIDETYSDVNQLSEELFKRLDKILEQSGTAENISDRKSKRKKKSNGSQKSIGSDMQTVCFGSLSPPSEEKFTVIAISPTSSNKPSRKPSMIPRPKIIMPSVTTNDKEFETINSQLRELQNDLGLQGCSDELEIGLMNNIGESNKTEKNDEQKKLPITETDINIALVDHKLAGVIRENSHTSIEESPIHSIRDGTSGKCISDKVEEFTESILANNPEETYSSEYIRAASQEVGFSNQQYSDIDTQHLGSQEVVADEDIPIKNFLELSEQYYTPIASPLVGIRDIEGLQKIEPRNNSELAKPREEDLNEDASSTDRVCFYDNVNKIISRVESVYNQLAQFEEIGLDGLQDPEQYVPKIPIFHDPPKIEDFEADSFLTPFMHAVKDLRKSVTETPNSTKSSPRLYRSPSYFNVLSLLETLTDLEERAVEIRTARVLHYSYSCHNSTVFQQAIIQNQCVQKIEPVQEPHTISECLKKTSSYSIMITSSTSTSQYGEINVPKKMSQCLEEISSNLSMFTATSNTQSEEEETNVPKKTSCHVNMITSTSTVQSDDEEINMPKNIYGCLKTPSSHCIEAVSTDQSKGVEINVKKKISGCLKKPSSPLSVAIAASRSKQKVSFLLQKEEKATQAMECPDVQKLSNPERLSSIIIINNKKDEQVSAYLDALECKSVDKMSLSDDDDSFKSNFELSDEISLEPEKNLQNSLETAENKKNDVEPVRDNVSEEKFKDRIRALHNDYEQSCNAGENFDYQIQIINGQFNEISILQARKYLTENGFKKQNGIEKIFENIRLESVLKQMLKESSLLEPLKEIHSFIDPKLLKDNIEEKKSGISIDNENGKCWNRETFLKGVYICVYLFMFTALKFNLNLECSVD